ncbi:hypothetical protein ELQ35_10460 [Peribacillus cavernae]|uniref:Uncharacterized protein n=1 Tax=Peribacillus cavernae TaxID=1674310 RepID=A0A433HLV3_9BACI|nr:hypothetical protein [Peribacillus cavernae]MDQ0218910.1 hypothetical protein [Peribacillus cavernae]RUQ29371.1 hypothetical protein ELQ35_10460 [Peribacillus cavernae]
MNKQIRLDEYTKLLLERRDQEERKEDIINDHNLKTGSGLTSPHSAMSTEELRLFMEYMDQANLRSLAKAKPELKKPLMLKKFFKSKRNQQVEVYSKSGEGSIYTLGKVSAVGRDFVMITNLKDRKWLPYTAIESANIPFGIPNYSNTHQHFIYDNNLRTKLLTNFGETVSKRDILVQQFFEESIETNLHSWKETWIEIQFGDQKVAGKIDSSEEGIVNLSFFGKKHVVPIKDITYVSNLRWFYFMTSIWKRRN